MKPMGFFAIAVLISTSAAADFVDGDYSFSGHCPTGDEWQGFDGRLTVTGNQFKWMEEECVLKNPVNIRGMDTAKLYDAQCTGYDQEWTVRIFVSQSDNSISTSFGKDAARWDYCGPIGR